MELTSGDYTCSIREGSIVAISAPELICSPAASKPSHDCAAVCSDFFAILRLTKQKRRRPHPRIKKKEKPPSLEETRFGNSGSSKEGPEVVRSSTTTAFSITADPVREGGSRRFAGFDERSAVHSAGDSEETQAVLIFTRIASFDNPSKDVN
jgi:hypothetical protein